jgi:hypothetical protein
LATSWKEIFGFDNPLQRMGDSIHPIEDGKDFRIRWRNLADSILQVLIERLPSSHDASIPSTLYGQFLRAWAEEMSRIRLEAEALRKDRYLVTSRSQYLYQKWGYILHVDNVKFPRLDWSSEIYRAFLQVLLQMYLGGSKKDVTEEGLSALSNLPVTLIELYTLEDSQVSDVDISDQFTFDVTIHLNSIAQVGESQNLAEDLSYVLDLVKPAHVKYRLRVVAEENWGLSGPNVGCTTVLGSGYLFAVRMNFVDQRSRMFQGVQEVSLEGEITEVNVAAGTAEIDGIPIRFDSDLELTTSQGTPVPLTSLQIGQLVYCEGRLVDPILTEDGFLVGEKITDTSVCDRFNLTLCEWFYDDIRRQRQYGTETGLLENLEAELTNYETVILWSNHKPWTRGDGSGLPPYATEDGTGGVKIWYTPPGGVSQNVSGKILFLFPSKGEVELLVEEGVETAAQAKLRYRVEYFFTSREVFISRESVNLPDQVLPTIRTARGPLVEGDGSSVLLVWPVSSRSLILWVNGEDRSSWIENVDPKLGEITLQDGVDLYDTDIVELSYWIWVEPDTPFIIGDYGTSLNDVLTDRNHRFLYRTVLGFPKEAETPQENITQYRYYGLMPSYTAALNDKASFVLNEFTESPAHALNRWSVFYNPLSISPSISEEAVEYYGAASEEALADPLRAALLSRGEVVRSDVPPMILKSLGLCNRDIYLDVSFRNRILQEGDAKVYPLFDDLISMTMETGDTPSEPSPSGLFPPIFSESGVDYLDEYHIPPELEYIMLNDWGPASLTYEGQRSLVNSCVIDPETSLVVNTWSSRLNWLVSILNPGCTVDTVPWFSADPVNIDRALNNWTRVLWPSLLPGLSPNMFWEFEESMGAMSDSCVIAPLLAFTDSMTVTEDYLIMTLDGDLIWDEVSCGFGAGPYGHMGGYGECAP